MIIIGADYHPGFQQIAFVDTDTESFRNGDCNTGRKRRSFIAISPRQPTRLIHGVIETWLFPFAKNKRMHRRSRS
jgi:hypothetical protein